MNQIQVGYHAEEHGRFVITNYNRAKPFSNFLPGVGGVWGIPLWAYYVNRNQCISSFGVRNKDGAILEFQSFDRALQLTRFEGFRTFLKVQGSEVYEPFRKSEDPGISQSMTVSSEGLEISDQNTLLEIQTNVRYSSLVGEPLPGLVRELRVKNIGHRILALEIVDGLSKILPYGVSQQQSKYISWHIQGMFGVDEIAGVPIFRLKQTAEDTPRIGRIDGGNFYFSVLKGLNGPLTGHFIVDPNVLFGESEDRSHPVRLEAKAIDDLLAEPQQKQNRTPCAFTGLLVELAPGEETVLYSLVGSAPDESSIRLLLKRAKSEQFFEANSNENQAVIARIKNHAFTVSSEPRFDEFCQQTFLDNVLRGGIPQITNASNGKNVLYTYSRKHGDLERDYNYFSLEPTFLSQGDGYYRDVNQNRRSDVWFFPEVEDAVIHTFMNLLQLDGYNPQVVGQMTYTVQKDQQFKDWLQGVTEDNQSFQTLLEVTSRPFTPGEFILMLSRKRRLSPADCEQILNDLLGYCRQSEVGGLHQGFWIDHWTYNLDLIDRYLEIYPERLKALLLDSDDFTFFDNPDVVLPRDQKYVLTDGKVRQYGAVARDPRKEAIIATRTENPHTVRTDLGQGSVYQTNLLVKLLSIVANKIATLDPVGIGMMMEADKPGWCDPMNGLPGLLGSSLCETLELERLCRFLRSSLDGLGLGDHLEYSMYVELHKFIISLDQALEMLLKSGDAKRRLDFWNLSNILKEQYRQDTRMGVDGAKQNISVFQIKSFLDKALKILQESTDPEITPAIVDNAGLCYTYFINEVKDFDEISPDGENRSLATTETGHPAIAATAFDSRPVTPFLEGPVHMLKVHPARKVQIFESVRRSKLYDNVLKMYRVCAPLDGEPDEIGRIRAYADGWIENGSIYLHMEYKWLLAMLQAGLHKEFFDDMRTTLIPFLDPSVYGRSVYECCSYIVSSGFPDPHLHGRGFQPRLSGCTAEVLHMWTLMVAGERLYTINSEGSLELRLLPILPGWFFTIKETTRTYYGRDGKPVSVEVPENAFAFNLLGEILVVYHNPERRDTFGDSPARVISYRLELDNGSHVEIEDSAIGQPFAEDVRRGSVVRIDALLG